MTVQLIHCDARHIPLADGIAQTCVTSPPYYGLRDYGTAKWNGGDAECEHTISSGDTDPKKIGQERVTRGDRQACLKCGATRIDAQIGLEQTPAAYVANIVQVMREVWRVLRDDGTLWLVIGDSYAGSGKGSGGTYELSAKQNSNRGSHYEKDSGKKIKFVTPGCKPKDLIGIPWRVAFALQDDGWYLRSDIIWHKPNPMPESVTDRPTKAHEYIFLLTKSQRYYYDAEAVSEAAVCTPRPETSRINPGTKTSLIKNDIKSSGLGWNRPELGRNRRTVWTVATSPYKGAHFATYPPALIEPCILAGSKAGDLVLDPFCGSGTTGAVALKNGRSFVGVELNIAYIELAQARIEAVQAQMRMPI